MSINQLSPVLIAAPYPGRSGARPAHEPAAEGIRRESSQVKPDPVERVVEVIDAISAERQDSQARRGADPLLFARKLDQSPRTMPGPRILEALIVRMSGSDVNAGPGQILNLSA